MSVSEDGGGKSREMGNERETDARKKQDNGGERLYPSVSGLQPSAQISPMGVQSVHLFKPAGQYTTCLGGSFTRRHTHTLTEAGDTQRWAGKCGVAVQRAQAGLFIVDIR